MERKLKSAVFITALLIALSFAAVPLRSFALSSDSRNGTVKAIIASVLTLQVTVDPPVQGSTTQEMSLSVFPNLSVEGDFTATVTTDVSYTLSINALGGDTNMNHETSSTAKIPGTGCTVQQGTDCWGIKGGNYDTFQEIPATLTTFYANPSPVAAESTDFTIGISVGPSPLAGSYTGTLVVTAINQ